MINLLLKAPNKYNNPMGMLSPQEVADELGVSRVVVWRWIRQGKLKAVKLTERTYRISKDDLDEFIKQRKK